MREVREGNRKEEAEEVEKGEHENIKQTLQKSEELKRAILSSISYFCVFYCITNCTRYFPDIS